VGGVGGGGGGGGGELTRLYVGYPSTTIDAVHMKEESTVGLLLYHSSDVHPWGLITTSISR